jgi:hypothetical protein
MGLQRISVAEPLENIAQLVRLNLAEAQGAIPSLTSPTRGGGNLWDSANEPLTTIKR